MRSDLPIYKFIGCCLFQVLPVTLALIFITMVRKKFSPNAAGYRNLSGNW
jgi:hypothetical protein